MDHVGNSHASSPTRAIALDMDGVVIDGMRFHVRAWQESFRRFLGAKVSEYRIYLGEGVKGSEFVEEVLAELGLNVSNAKKGEIYNFKKRYFRDIFRVEVIPGIEDLIGTIRELGYSLALVTGTGRDVALQALSSLGQLQSFACVVGGDDVEKGKPSPDPYLLAISELAVPREYCLAVENAPAGIASAKAAGLTCVAVATSLSRAHLGEADMVVSNNIELREKLLEEYSISRGLGPWKF